MINNKPVVIVIEDQSELGRLYGKLVHMAGGIAEIIENGDDAYRRLTINPVPDLLLIDLHLPGMSGENILSAAKRMSHLHQCLKIVVTADEQLGRAIEAQYIADDVLIKPVPVATFMRLIGIAKEKALSWSN
jgi:CheY-like chemotaxis protein